MRPLDRSLDSFSRQFREVRAIDPERLFALFRSEVRGILRAVASDDFGAFHPWQRFSFVGSAFYDLAIGESDIVLHFRLFC